MKVKGKKKKRMTKPTWQNWNGTIQVKMTEHL